MLLRCRAPIRLLSLLLLCTVALRLNNSTRFKMASENINFLIDILYKGEPSVSLTHIRMLMKPDFFEKNAVTCQNILKKPYFDMDVVVGKPWRIYYTWNLKIDTRCLDMVFNNATPKIVQRIWSDMSEYLEQQPIWEAATLHMSLGSARHELLLFADQGAAGSFVAVPNVVRDANMMPLQRAVPLLKFHMKLLREGKFLLVMDCHVGGTSLSARTDTPLYRSELAAEASALDLGDGYPACTTEKNKEEHFFVK